MTPPPCLLRNEEIIGNLRVNKQFSKDLFIFSGLSQGFRPSILYDLTSTDKTSAVERPEAKLDPKTFCRLNWEPEEIQFHGNGKCLITTL